MEALVEATAPTLPSSEAWLLPTDVLSSARASVLACTEAATLPVAVATTPWPRLYSAWPEAEPLARKAVAPADNTPWWLPPPELVDVAVAWTEPAEAEKWAVWPAPAVVGEPTTAAVVPEVENAVCAVCAA